MKALLILLAFAAATQAALLPTVRWNNGESMSASLVGATGTTATFKTSLFEEPVTLQWNAIRRIDLPIGPPSPLAAPPDDGFSEIRSLLGWQFFPGLPWPIVPDSPSDAFIFTMRDGSTIHADLLAVTGSSVAIRGTRYGDLLLDRSQVLSARRTRSRDVILAGPTGDAGWQPLTPKDDGTLIVDRHTGDSSPLAVGPGGALQFLYWNRAARLNVSLPDSVEIEFHLHSSGRPDFLLALADQPGTSLQVETWTDEIVLSQGASFQPAKKLGKDEHDIALLLCWDGKSSHCALYTPSGGLLADWSPAPSDAKPPRALILQNKGRDLTLTYLSIRPWLPPKKSSILDLQSSLSPVSQADEITFSSDPPARVPDPFTLTYADGTWLRGRITAISNGAATLATSFSSQPVVARLDSLRQILLDSQTNSTPALATLDTLQIGRNTLHGTFIASGAPSPLWLPIGAGAPVTPSKTLPYQIVRYFPDDAPSPPAAALFYTRAGDVLSGTLHALDRTGAEFDSGITRNPKLPAAALSAIQFGIAAGIAQHGFTDPSWRLLSGGDLRVTRTAGSLALEQGASIGNSSAMQCRELRFRLDTNNFWGMRFRMFCAGTDPAKSTNLLFAAMNGCINCGIEGSEAQFDEPRFQARAPSGIVDVRMVIQESGVDIYFNGLCALKIPVPISGRAGAGLIIEPVGIWGNSVQTVQISNFSMLSSPGSAWLPDVAADAKIEALTIPRFRRDDPPTHALIAANGDILRGEVEGATNNTFGFRSGMDDLAIPRDRVKAVVWLPKPIDAPASSPPPATNSTQDHLNEKLNTVMSFGGADLQTFIDFLQNQSPDLKFKLPAEGISDRFSLTLGDGTISSALDRICALYGLEYRVEDSGVIVLEPAGTSQSDAMIRKVYWLKPGAFPAQNPPEKVLAAKGILFPSGASAAWDSASNQLTVRNTPENQARLAQLLTSDFGGIAGSPTHWLVLTTGARLALAVDRFGKDTVTGWQPLYGACAIPTAEVAAVRTDPPDPSAAMRALAGWQTVYAPEPVLPEAGGDSSALIGKQAPGFKLPLLDGSQFDLSAEKGKIVVLDFWATWCGPCIHSLPGLIQSMSGFSPDRVKFVAIDQDEPSVVVKQFLETRGWTLPAVLDDGAHVGQLYGADSIPLTVVIAADGKIAWVKSGYTDEPEAAKEVTQLLSAPSPH